MNSWGSRFIAIILLGLILATGTASFDHAKLAWLKSTPPEQVIAHQREVYQHGYVFQAIAMIAMLGLAVLSVECVSWLIRKMVPSTPSQSSS